MKDFEMINSIFEEEFEKKSINESIKMHKNPGTIGKKVSSKPKQELGKANPKGGKVGVGSPTGGKAPGPKGHAIKSTKVICSSKKKGITENAIKKGKKVYTESELTQTLQSALGSANYEGIISSLSEIVRTVGDKGLQQIMSSVANSKGVSANPELGSLWNAVISNPNRNFRSLILKLKDLAKSKFQNKRGLGGSDSFMESFSDDDLNFETEEFEDDSFEDDSFEDDNTASRVIDNIINTVSEITDVNILIQIEAYIEKISGKDLSISVPGI